MKFRMSVSRTSNHMVRISIEDVLSGIEFIEMEMMPKDFGNMITGLCSQPADGNVRDLDFIGKRHITEDRQVTCPIDTYAGREEYEQWLEGNCQEKGWTINSYLGTQKSIIRSGAGVILNYSVSKYV